MKFGWSEPLLGFPARHRLRWSTLPCLGALLIAPACTVYFHPPEAPPGVEPLAAWGRVLASDFQVRGDIRLDKVRPHDADLGAFVAWVAQPGAEPAAGSGASTKERLAFGLNAYTALYLFAWLRAGPPWPRGARGEPFFDRRLFCVGGRWVSLRQFEEDVVSPLGDTRAMFALRCLSFGGPRLPREPFTAPLLDEQLDQLMREFLDDRRNVEVHASGTRVRLSPWIRAHADDLQAAGLDVIAFCNRWRTLPIPAGCAVEYGRDEVVGVGRRVRT